MKRTQLFSTLGLPAGTVSTIINANGTVVTGIVLSIEREDGSGHSFNVRMHCVRNVNHCGMMRTVYVRTID